MLMRLNPASRQAAAFSGEMVSGSASSVTSSNCDRERSANRLDDLREVGRVEKAGRSAAEIHGVNHSFRDIRDPIFTAQTREFGDFAADRADIRRVQFV